MVHEIEFTYKQEKYSITTGAEGRVFTKFNNLHLTQKFEHVEGLLENIRICSHRLDAIWYELESISIF